MNNDLKRILIVDDEEAILFAFKRVLDAPGLEVHTAETMAQALDLIEQNAYAVVIADLRLSGTTCDDGYTVIKVVAEKQEKCKIIVMTAYGDSTIREKVFSLGADFYLGKPVSPYKVKDLIVSMGVYESLEQLANSRV
jgi:CheY-like chemotaxis protein